MPSSKAAAKAPAKKAARTVAKPATKTASAKMPSAKPTKAAKAAGLPRFGRAGTAGKAEGDEAVRAWMAGVKPEHRELVERLDALIADAIPGVKRAVKWSMPLYGLPGQGWLVHLGSFKGHVAIGFFAGASLQPPLPAGDAKGMRRHNIRGPEDFDERRIRSWVQQAARLPGWGRV